MRPGKQEWTGAQDLFRARLDQIINMQQDLVKLAGTIDWAWIDQELAACFSEEGRPGLTTRFMVGLLLLKQIYGLSDEEVCARWVYDPYFQHFTGEEFFAHAFPHERSGMSHWRKRIGPKLDLLLAESLRVAHASGALKTDDLARITIDTTVQPKNVTHPTDAKLMLTAIEKLGTQAKAQELKLRQSYARLAKRAALMAGRYTHAKQFKRANRELRFLRTRLGRLIRDIRRKIDGREPLQRFFAEPRTAMQGCQKRNRNSMPGGTENLAKLAGLQFSAPNRPPEGLGELAAVMSLVALMRSTASPSIRREAARALRAHMDALPPATRQLFAEAPKRSEILFPAIVRAWRGWRGDADVNRSILAERLGAAA